MYCVLNFNAYKGKKCYDPEEPVRSGRILLKLLQVTSAADLLLTGIKDELEGTGLEPKGVGVSSLRFMLKRFIRPNLFYRLKDTKTKRQVNVDPLRAFTKLAYVEGKQRLDQFLTACDLGKPFLLSEFFDVSSSSSSSSYYSSNNDDVENEATISQEDFLPQNTQINLQVKIKYNAVIFKQLYKVWCQQGNGVVLILTKRLKPILLSRPSSRSNLNLTAKLPEHFFERLLSAYICNNMTIFSVNRIRENFDLWERKAAQSESYAPHSFSP